jgi:hypothetical protein
VQQCAVEAREVGFLQLYGAPVLLEALLNPLCAALVGLAVHGTGSEVALLLAEGVGGVSQKLYADHGL